jgi:polar amino acid transport system substrate-binding protein
MISKYLSSVAAKCNPSSLLICLQKYGVIALLKAKFITYTFFFILLCCLCNQATFAQTNEHPLSVKYTENGTQHTIIGLQTEQGYQFNLSSNKVLNLATLNWPPYIGESLCNKGWVFQFTVALLVSKGYQVNIHFYPWARSVMLVEKGKMDILFPEYFIENSAPSDTVKGKNRRELLSLSNPFSGGKISIMKRKNYEFSLTEDLSTLKGKIIGVVRGYQNTPEFDAMMDAKQFSVVEAVNELQLMNLLKAKRVDLIIGDPTVFSHNVKFSTLSYQKKQDLLNEIEPVEPALKYNYLYYAVSNKYSQWHELLRDINTALLTFQQSGETTRFIDTDTGNNCTINL